MTQVAQQEQEYKETELGLLPKDWNVVRLGDILKEVNIKARSLKTEIERIPILSMTRYKGLILQTEKFGKRVAGKDVKDYRVVRKDNIVYSFPMDEGVIYSLQRFDIGLVSPTYFVWELVNKEVDVNFLDILLKTPILISTYTMLSSKTVHRRRIVKKDDFSNIKISIPPFSEQQKIVAILSTIRYAQEKTDNVVGSLKELKKSLLKHLFTYGAVSFEEAEKVKLIETEIGSIPEGWEVKRIGDITETHSGGTPNRGKEEYWNGDIPWAKSGELDDSRIYKVEERISQEGLENSSAKYVNNDDLLIAMYGATAGKVGIAKSSFAINQAICAIKPNKNFISEFYFYYLIFIRDKILRQRYGGAQPNLNQQIIKNLEVPVPMITEQGKIASILFSVDEKIKAEKGRNEALSELFRSMLSNLMNAKIRVKNLEVKNVKNRE